MIFEKIKNRLLIATANEFLDFFWGPEIWQRAQATSKGRSFLDFLFGESLISYITFK